MGIAERRYAADCLSERFLSTPSRSAAGRASTSCATDLHPYWRVCGLSCGFSDFGDGKTHQSVEDVSLMRSLPNMTVLCPAHSIQTLKMMECLIDWPGPAYIRINRSDLPFLYPAGEPYHIGKITKLRDGSDVALLAAGVMVSRSLEAARLLAEEGISARVFNLSTIKPLDRGALIEAIAGARAIVVSEEHNIVGGLGSAVLEALRAVPHAPVELVGTILLRPSAAC
ncbi:MAG: hypothetical protein L7F78_08310 [Syntrophales bacterium LBB04]|nr:hypothetical protein [Syntrophales bacterium LBB04]